MKVLKQELSVISCAAFFSFIYFIYLFDYYIYFGCGAEVGVFLFRPLTLVLRM